MADYNLPRRGKQDNSDRSPELQALLTQKKRYEREWDEAQVVLENTRRALNAFTQAQQNAQADWQEYCKVWNAWQTAQRTAEVVKTTETTISELKYRILFGGVLILVALLLAAIQVTPSSMLVVLVLGCLPCLYVAAKVLQLVRALRALPSKNEVGDPISLGKSAEKWRQRYERTQGAVRKLEDQSILVARVRTAEADVTAWEFRINDAEVQIQKRISFEQQRKWLQQQNS
ncbi:MAG TPA: hypothetical protein VFV38_27205 [Ktedonobacteraceae bacterium]|nr:hypothetical protein [Ktedonobacteraceae bacterium]